MRAEFICHLLCIGLDTTDKVRIGLTKSRHQRMQRLLSAERKREREKGERRKRGKERR